MSLPALEARNLTYRVGDRILVEDVSFTVPAGSFAAIIGPNGAGKSTLMRMLCGLLRPYSGEALVDGQAVSRMPRRAVATRMAYVPQSPPTNIPFTVGEFAAMARYAQGIRLGGLDAAGRAAVDEALELTGCADLRHRLMHTLSGGESRKAHLAAALAQGAELLLLDEPTTHLDYRHQREVVQLLQRAHAARGLTVVAVQHDLNQGVLTADTVLAMKNGRAFYTGAPQGLIDGGLLEPLFDTPFNVVSLPGDSLHVAPRHD